MNNSDVLQAFQILSSIQQESSTLGKHNLLQQNKTNEVLKNLLYLSYNPYLQFYIKKIPIVTTGNEDYVHNYLNFLQLLGKLSHREVTGNAAIEAVKITLSSCNKEEQLWYSRVLSKDLKIGLADKGINKVFTKLIPTYEVMLAEKIDPNKILDDPKTQKILPRRMTLQYKIDGYRLNIHRPSEDEVIIRTRNGKLVSGYHNLEESAKQLPVGYVYDGEIVDPKMLQWVQNNIVHHGIHEANRQFFNETMSHAFSKESNKKGIFIVFDVVPINDWILRHCLMTYESRFQLLTQLVQPLELNDIVLITSSKVFCKDKPEDLKEMLELFHQFVSVGWEGAMIKDLKADYEWKRTKSLLKMKLILTLQVSSMLQK